MSEKFRFNRAEYRKPPVQLMHVDLELKIYDDQVEGREIVHFLPREAVSVIVLDAQALEIGEVTLKGRDGSERLLTTMYLKRENKLEVMLPREYQPGEKIILCINAVSRPTHNILDGIYYDTTPAGAPPQLISQCQQWGFQRIMPIIDDCTAKCTWRTTLEGSSRYTHLITNGDISHDLNPDGVPVLLPGDPLRRRITYVNNIPMPSYLFLVAAGTWDVLEDSVTTDAGRVIRLDYLVPPGLAAGARMPMAILKDAVLWHSRRLHYDYKRDCYRTICMEKSNFGGMENVGNTTIITEAALIDDWTTDRRLVYAHGVIIHEFEHNHCGSDVTMETPFDMWLNEAYTVNIEREYVSHKFGRELMRLDDLDAMRSPLHGPLAVEDGGTMGRIVREGFNHPDEVVDGVTYVKAPEVLGMLRALIGDEKFEQATAEYFAVYQGGNANTEQFLDSFRKVADRDLDPFLREWLFTIGYPAISGTYRYDAKKRTLTVALSQRRRGGPGKCFVVPFHVAGVDAAGKAMKSVDRLLVLEDESAEFVFEGVEKAPAFLDWNSGRPFYGSFEDLTATPAVLAETVRGSPFLVGRVEAMRGLADAEMASMIADAGHKPSADWLKLFSAVLADDALPNGIKARLLTVPEEMLARDFLPRAAERNLAARRLRKLVAASCGEPALLAAFNKARRASEDEPLETAIPRRSLCAALETLLAEIGSEAAFDAIVAQFESARGVSDRLNAARAINGTDSPRRFAVMESLGKQCREHVSAYGAYLQVVAASPRPDVFEAIAHEEKTSPYRMEHPSHSRSLYGAMAANNAQVWTEQGLSWMQDTLGKLATVNENVALVVLAAFQLVDTMQEPLRGRVRSILESLEKRVDAAKSPSLHGRITKMLGKQVARRSS